MLEYFFGHELFQRFGALLVGFGLLHYYLLEDIKTKMLEHSRRIDKFGPSITQFLPCDRETNPENYIKALMALCEDNGFQIEGKRATAEVAILDDTIRSINELPNLKRFERQFKGREIWIVLIGTIIWAFGDMVTNFISVLYNYIM